MNKNLLYILCVFIFLNNNLNAEDKLDLLDKQSKEFFKAITGLEKDYLEKQIVDIKKKADKKVKKSIPALSNQNANSLNNNQIIVENQVSQEEYAKNVFQYENEMARLTTDFTRTKKLKDIKIKSMYSFNSNKYVVLKLVEDEEEAEKNKEASLKIEGRYKKGDDLLTHKIVDINTQTKTVTLYKKLDEDYGYYIILSNYGISVSDLKKVEKKQKEVLKNQKKEITKSLIDKETKDFIKFKEVSTKKEIKNINDCLFRVKTNSLNVRNDTTTDATIVRVLRKNDEFTIQSKKGDWVKINTLYKNKSGDVMILEDENNWVRVLGKLVDFDNRCL